EMCRVLAPDGRLVISAVNYGSFSARLSRLLYAAARGVRLVSLEKHLFWDSPVPIEHTFECTYERLRQLFGPYLEFDRGLGVSIGWGVPFWGRLLDRVSRQRAMAMLQRLDGWATRAPSLADFIYTVWRPRPAKFWPVHRAPDEGGYVVQPDDVVYSHRVKN